jgi:prepilin-type N-terminal cleavage/methylation domain-containing protein/prepilin-type processing-associated H-X9-DG protein
MVIIQSNGMSYMEHELIGFVERPSKELRSPSDRIVITKHRTDDMSNGEFMTLSSDSKRNSAKPRPAAFTLVELLVVIGIIAILIAILLPALSKARKQANQVKCAAALREVGMGFQLYSNDQNGWWPICKLDPALLSPSLTQYNIDGFNFTTAQPAYWYNFIGDYVVAANLGYAGTTGINLDEARRSVLWGCPAWAGYQPYAATPGGINYLQPGYGMNDCPAYQKPVTVDYVAPAASFNILSGGPGQFYKQVQWTDAAERALVADSQFWLDECEIPPARPSYPAAVSQQGQNAVGSQGITYNGPDQTMVDIYRHGTTPGVVNPGSTSAVYKPSGGNIEYNILYCDGHVAQLNDSKEAYISYRMRFPD